MTANYHPVQTLAREPPVSFHLAYTYRRTSRSLARSHPYIPATLSRSPLLLYLKLSLPFSQPYLPYIRFKRMHAYTAARVHTDGHGRDCARSLLHVYSHVLALLLSLSRSLAGPSLSRSLSRPV